MKSRDNSGSLESPVFTATILSGATQSNAVNLDGFTIVGFEMPAAFTGTTLSIQRASTVGGTYVNAQDGAGSDISLTVAASKYIPFSNYALVAGWQFIKFTSGLSEGADRTITLAVRPV